MEGSGQLRPNLPEAATDQLGRRLDSWKEIAAYLGRSQKTVQRWEETQELPVHRLLHEKRGSVYAYTSELDAWREARKSGTESPILNESRPPIVDIQNGASTRSALPGLRRHC
jgi:predicted DNA-binding transcriptional regulator AlpA